jgi:hypothetical protein
MNNTKKIIIYLFCIQNSFSNADILLKNISLIIPKKYNFTCVFNNLEEILNKIIVFLEIFYYSNQLF